jgi:tetratricopeptide (TPR) repeat protein
MEKAASTSVHLRQREAQGDLVRGGSMESPAQASLKGSARLGSYLRRLRTGYGYSLRRVEERARAEGGEIDNSQLSRYEKGICYPSFDKLRVLASVFNVSIQSFSDVVELEAFEELKPESGEPRELVEQGTASLQQGEHGRAFACYERALELLYDRSSTDLATRELIGEVRIHLAIALRRMGKLALAEQELRNALRDSQALGAELRTRAVLTLAGIHAHQGERFLAELEAGRAYEMAKGESQTRFAAMALHIQAHVLAELSRYEEAIQRSREASALYEQCGENYESIRLRVNVGTYYVSLGKAREGLRMLNEILAETRKGEHRRLESLVWSAMGEAYDRVKDPQRARRCFRESDALAMHNNERQNDILFFNAYHEWQMALRDDNPTGAKIAFGRLRTLRSSLERRFPEVEAFDEHVEKGRQHA